MKLTSILTKFLVRFLIMSDKSWPRYVWMSLIVIVLINIAVIIRLLPTNQYKIPIDRVQRLDREIEALELHWLADSSTIDKSKDKSILEESKIVRRLRDTSARNRSSVFAFKGENFKESFTPEAEVRHVYFLKVHKAASSTMMNIILRFAIQRNLSVMLPRTGNNIHTFRIKDSLLPSFHENRTYDVMSLHAVYYRQVMAQFFPKDTVYIGIVRQPFDQFVSAFVYYRERFNMKYLRIQGDNPIRTYLQNPFKYEPKKPGFSFTNNRMAYDFGYPPRDFQNITKFKEYLRQLDSELNFVLVVEYFTESLILLKRVLNWSFRDILYVTRNVRKTTTLDSNLTESDRQIHKRFATLDYALYEHFKSVLLQKISKTGPGFHDEVKHFEQILERVKLFCEKFTNIGRLLIEESPYNTPFFVTKQDCVVFHMQSYELIRFARQKHASRLDQLGIKYCPLDKKMWECKNRTQPRSFKAKRLHTKLVP